MWVKKDSAVAYWHCR